MNLSFYYENSNNLTPEQIKEFILKIIDIEISRLNISTPIETLFLYNNNLDYAGALTPNYEIDSSKHFVLPLRTKKYTLEINMPLIEENFRIVQNNNISVDGVLIPTSLNFLSWIVQLCSHEVRHAYQNENVKNNNANEVESILWLKQDLVRNYFKDIYDLNYDNYITEQDSNNYQPKLSFELLDKYSKLSGNVLKQYKEYLKDREIVKFCDKKLDVLYSQVDDQKTKRFATAYIIELFDEIVKELPKDFISNSLLKFEYNSDGSKKNYIDLLIDKENYAKQGINYDKLYDFIIKCDYNLQVQKLCIELESSNSMDTVSKLKKAYHSQELTYKNIHETLQKTQNNITKEIKKLTLEHAKNKVSVFEYSKEHIKLLKLSNMCKKIENKLESQIDNYNLQKKEYLEDKEKYITSMKYIEEYKRRKNILDVLKDGKIIDITNYNKLISMVIQELNNKDIDSDYKEFLLKVKESIQLIHFPTTLENNNNKKSR